MSSDWPEVALGEVAFNFAMGPFGSNITTDNFVSQGVPVIRGVNLPFDKRFNCDDFVFLTEEKAEELKSSNANADNIVITHRGTLGQVGIIPHNTEYKRFVVSQSQMKFMCKPDILDPNFIYYFLKSPIGQHRLLANTSVTGVPAIARPLTSLKAMRINLPPLSVQKQIASILSSLDDKIELNSRINKTLEEMAQAIFKRWFVDFEFPDENGNPYKSSGGEMVESELGLIPKGWRVGTLSDIANITMGQSPNGSSFNENGLGTVFYQGRAEFGWRYPTQRLFTSEPKRMAKAGNILMSVRAPVGDINIANEDCCIGRGLVAIKSIDRYNSYLLYTILALKEKLEIYNREGTVFGSINKDTINNLTVLIPKAATMYYFDTIASGYDEQIKINTEQIQILTSVRDFLLPKFINGDII